MKFLITAGLDADQQRKDAPFDEALFVKYMQFNEQLQKAGVLVASEGLNLPKGGVAIGVKDGKRVVLDGPFVESKELIGGFYVVDVKDRAEAVEWALKCPTGLGFDDLLKVYPLTGADDLPAELVALATKAAPEWSKTFTKKGGAR